MEIPKEITEKQYHPKFEKLVRKKARQAFKRYNLMPIPKYRKIKAFHFKEKFRGRILNKLGV